MYLKKLFLNRESLQALSVRYTSEVVGFIRYIKEEYSLDLNKPNQGEKEVAANFDKLGKDEIVKIFNSLDDLSGALEDLIGVLEDSARINKSKQLKNFIDAILVEMKLPNGKRER